MANYSVALDLKFRALADGTRRGILEALAVQDLPVLRLAELFSHKLPTILKHLRALEEAGLVTSKKSGRTRVCTRNAGAMSDVHRWLEECHYNWDAKLDRLQALVEKGENH